MRRLINYIDKNLLLKIASLNSVAVITRVFVGFLTSKAIAYFIGPTGMALVGNFRDFMASTRTFASLGFYNGIVKYVAEFKEDTVSLAKSISTVFYSVVIFSIVLSFLIYFNSNLLNRLVFDDNQDFDFVFKLLAIALPFYSMNLLLMAVLNGASRFKFLLNVSIVGQLLSGLLTIFLIWKQSLTGAMIAIVLSEIVVLLIVLAGVFNHFEKLFLINIKRFNIESLKNLSAYSVMTLFTAATLPLTYIFIRNYISDQVGLDEAGYWEAMNRISKYYLMFISSLLTLYILPRFSEITTNLGFRNEVLNFYKNILPFFIMGLIIIYFLREYIIVLIFTNDFLAMENLFFWQMIGDIIKVITLVISYQMLAKKMLWAYLITETISLIILISTSIYFIQQFGTIGATMAHFVTYVIYFFVILFIFRRHLFSRI